MMPLNSRLASHNHDYDYHSQRPAPGENIWKTFAPADPGSAGDGDRAPGRRHGQPEHHLRHRLLPNLPQINHHSRLHIERLLLRDQAGEGGVGAGCIGEGISSGGSLVESCTAAASSASSSASTSPSTAAVSDYAAAAWRLNSSYLQDLNTSASDCIELSVVLPYPVPETPKQSAGSTPSEDLGLDAPPNSGSSSGCSVSEDEDGDEHEDQEEEEEMDVVKKQQAVKCWTPVRLRSPGTPVVFKDLITFL